MQFSSDWCNYAFFYNAAEVGIFFTTVICQPNMAFGTIAVNIVMTAKRKTVVAEDRTTYRIVSMTIKIVASRRTLLK